MRRWLLEAQAAGRAAVRRVAEREHAAVRRDEPVSVPGRCRRDADDRFLQARRDRAVAAPSRRRETRVRSWSRASSRDRTSCAPCRRRWSRGRCRPSRVADTAETVPSDCTVQYPLRARRRRRADGRSARRPRGGRRDHDHRTSIAPPRKATNLEKGPHGATLASAANGHPVVDRVRPAFDRVIDRAGGA